MVGEDGKLNGIPVKSLVKTICQLSVFIFLTSLLQNNTRDLLLFELLYLSSIHYGVLGYALAECKIVDAGVIIDENA